MLDSNYRELCAVSLPSYGGRQKYMHSFDLANPIMAPGYEDYLEPVTQLCQAAGVDTGIGHMTADEKIVMPGMSQRRPGPHVDGCFIPEQMSWSHPSWEHYSNNSPIARMPVIVAASVSGCRAWRGKFEAMPSPTGDLSHIIDQLDDGEILPPNIGYLLSPDCIHESMIFNAPTKRTFLRIALPVGSYRI